VSEYQQYQEVNAFDYTNFEEEQEFEVDEN
jgi:hypothetical protein